MMYLGIKSGVCVCQINLYHSRGCGFVGDEGMAASGFLALRLC